ncbi:unnamed protein product, partial [Prorocentrum cordatum]
RAGSAAAKTRAHPRGEAARDAAGGAPPLRGAASADDVAQAAAPPRCAGAGRAGGPGARGRRLQRRCRGGHGGPPADRRPAGQLEAHPGRRARHGAGPRHPPRRPPEGHARGVEAADRDLRPRQHAAGSRAPAASHRGSTPRGLGVAWPEMNCVFFG